MSLVRYESTTAASAKPTRPIRSIVSGLRRRKFRSSAVARRERDGSTSCARIDADRSSRKTTSWRSYSGVRAASSACGRTTAKTRPAAAATPHTRTAAARVGVDRRDKGAKRSEEHTSELQSLRHLVCRLLLEK